MAEFNPFLPQPNIPDWTNAPGRLIDGSGAGEIFGKLALSVGSTLAEANKKRIENNIYDAADKAAEEGRIESMSASAGIPADLARGMGKAELYRKAFENGNYSHAAFYTKMDVWAKEMKSKFPNYRDVIDGQTARVMGGTPANQELDEVRKMYESAMSANSESSSKLDTFISNHTEFLSPDEIVQLRNGDNETVERIKTKALILKGDKARLESEMSQLENNAKAGALEAAPVLSQAVSNIQREFYLGAVSKGGGSLKNLRETLAKLREGGFTPEETAMADQLITEAKAELQQKWVTAVTTPGENGKSLQDYFASNPEAWNTQKAKIDEMIGSLDDLKTGKSGIFEWNATMTAASTNARAEKLRDQFGAEAYDGFKAIVDLVGTDNAMTMYQNLTMTEGMGDPLSAMMTQLVFGKAVKKDANIGDAVEDLSKTVDPSLQHHFNKGVRAGVESVIKTAIDSKLPVEARQAALTSILSDTDNKFLRNLKDTPDKNGLSSREKAFLRLSSPEVERVAKELGMEKQYTEWVRRSAVPLYSGAVEQVNSSNVNSKYVDITFNPNTLAFEARINRKLVPNAGKVEEILRSRGNLTVNPRGPQPIPYSEISGLRAAFDSVQKLNMINQALSRALKAEKPGISQEDLAREVQAMMGDLNVNYQKQDPILVRAVKAVGDFIIENSVFTGGLEKGSKQDQKDMLGEDFGAVPEGDTSFNAIDSGLGDEDASAILNFVSGAEGADYNTLFGGSKVILEEKTVAEVQQMQRAHGKKTGSSATGAYQVMRKTLSDLIDRGVVDPDEPFTPDVQNRIGMALLQRRGYDEWKAGEISTAEFANRLALEWASLPNANGRSSYEGVMGNKATRSRQELIAMLESIKG